MAHLAYLSRIICATQHPIPNLRFYCSVQLQAV